VTLCVSSWVDYHVQSNADLEEQQVRFMTATRKQSRRQFLAQTVSTLALPMIVPSSVLGRDGTAPSERVTLGVIGAGGRGMTNLGFFLKRSDTQVVAACDVDRAHRTEALKAAKLDITAGYSDFRAVLDRKDIDAVMVTTPDHWHAIMSIAAMKTGKDVYCEKPLASSISESKAVRDVTRAERRVLQCGTHRRSIDRCRFACELVRNGRIGTLKTIQVGVPGEFVIRGGHTGLEGPTAVPEGFDYPMWLGPAPLAPYTPARCHFNFRWIRDYAPGYITDWGAHFLDIAQWGSGMDGSGPERISASELGVRDTGIYDALESFRIHYTYQNGVTVVMATTTDSTNWGVKFVGDKGHVFMRLGSVTTEPENLMSTKIGADEIHLYKSDDHYGNFIECVRSRKETAASSEIGHRAATMCHLGTIAADLKRELRWDPKLERIENDDEANLQLGRPLRAPWSLG
jgi:predicted dehydrogenase